MPEEASYYLSDPRFIAGVDALGRTGALSFEIRYQDDTEPTVWIAVSSWNRGPDGIPVPAGTPGVITHEAAGALTPTAAVSRLLELVLDGGLCVHCRRPTGVTDNWRADMPLAEVVCWQQYDPELQRYRRSCEGDTPKRGRNEECWCESGRKFKHCHGA